MDKVYKFEAETLNRIVLDDYSDDEFAIARMGFLSTRPNSHELHISEDVLRESAPTALGKWLVVDMTGVIDAGTHTSKEHIVGYIPPDQDVEFVYDDDEYLRAYVDVVVSKIYAKDFIALFEDDDNLRSVSVEMKVETPDDDENEVLSFKIVGVTVLGKNIRPSCPESDIKFVRFSESDAGTFYNQIHKDALIALKKFAEERKNMAESKKYKIDKSKDAISDTAWGDVDKTKLRNAVVNASNASTLVKSVYLRVESGWEDAPSEKLGYPVMELKGDTFVYNRHGLASAKAYAEQNNETAVINKLNKIYKSLGLDETDGKEDTTKMSKEVEFAAVDISNLWGNLWDIKADRHEWDYEIVGIYEENNQKFAILKGRDAKMYRWNFSLTEEDGIVADDEIIELEFVETDNMKHFAEPENVKDYRFEEDKSDDEDEDEDSDDDDKHEEDDDEETDEQKMARLASDIESRDNIIMENERKMAEMEAELAELRAFKDGIERIEMAKQVDAVIETVSTCMSEEDIKNLRDEGLACTKETFAAFSNKVKAIAFDAGATNKTQKKQDDGILSFSAPKDFGAKTEPTDVWEKLKSRSH